MYGQTSVKVKEDKIVRHKRSHVGTCPGLHIIDTIDDMHEGIYYLRLIRLGATENFFICFVMLVVFLSIQKFNKIEIVYQYIVFWVHAECLATRK